MKKGKKISVVPATPPSTDINVTPLVDVVLVLLIIFMVVAPLLVKQFHLLLPPQEKSEAPRCFQEYVAKMRVRGVDIGPERVTVRARAAPLGERDCRHGLRQAQRLRGELHVVTGRDPRSLGAAAVLVFHREGRAVGLELDHVALADQAQAIAPHR